MCMWVRAMDVYAKVDKGILYFTRPVNLCVCGLGQWMCMLKLIKEFFILPGL